MVQQGDSMWAISQRLGITLQALKDANPQVKPTEFQINVGDVLKIPGKGPGPKPPGGTPSGTYIVQSGDSMWAISERLGINLQALKDANPQVRPPDFRINVGDVLKIPGGKSPGTGHTPGGPTTSGGTYTVQQGDSMWAISERLGITLQALKDANPQVRPPDFRINAGDILKISGGKPGGSRYYTVVSGDSLYIIANAHGVSLEALKAANPQVQPPQFLINVGQVITIP